VLRWTASLLVFLSLVASGCPDENDDRLLTEIACDACDGDCLIEQFAVTSASHVAGGIDYYNRPPVAGDHDPCWAPYGVHETEVGDEHWVHNLEHGAVVMLYNCPSGCANEAQVLVDLSEELPAETTLISPYSLMESRFAAVSWAWRITLGCADEQALRDFYDEHVGQAPEATSAAPPESCME